MVAAMEMIEERAARISRFLERDRAGYLEVRLSRMESTSITLAGPRRENVSSGAGNGGSIRLLRDGFWHFYSFNDLDSLEEYLASDRLSDLPSLPPGSSRVKNLPPVRNQYQASFLRDPAEVPFEEKMELVEGYNAILRESEKIQSTRVMYRDSRGYHVFMNSEGSHLSWDRVHCGVSLSAVARDGSVIQPAQESRAGIGGFEMSTGLEEDAEMVARRAVDLLKAEPLSGGSYRVVADNRLTGVFVHEAFGHLSEADFVYENPGLRSVMEMGREFAPEDVTIVDDGSLEGEAGYIPFDNEGVPSSRTPLIEKGRLAGRLHNRETAEIMDEPVTGNGRSLSVFHQPIVRMTNTFMEPGRVSVDELFQEVEDGIYACGVIGGQTNLEMFTFTSAYGYRIKKGKPGKMFRDIVLSGNVFTTLKNIRGVADDLKLYGGLGGCGKGGQAPLPVSYGGPHILVDDVLVGGGSS
jgi:TldD protein